MTEVRMTMEEYLQLIQGLSSEMPMMPAVDVQNNTSKAKRRMSAYQKRYKANFKKISNRFKLKNGKWKKNGFKQAVKLAHKMSKK